MKEVKRITVRVLGIPIFVMVWTMGDSAPLNVPVDLKRSKQTEQGEQ